MRDQIIPHLMLDMTGLYRIPMHERKTSIMQHGNQKWRLKYAQIACLGHGVAAVNAEIRPSDVFRGIAKKKSDGAHQVLRCTHLASRNERGPLVAKLGVLVEDLAGSE